MPPPDLLPEQVARELARRISAPPRLDESPLTLPGDAWQRWLLVALAAHAPRQRWVASIIKTHLGGDIEQLGSFGACGHPKKIPQSGQVPGLPGWSYFFHGIGCCLTHTDGTAIDVDFDERGADGIDPYFYLNYLESLPILSGVEALLWRPAPFTGGCMVDLHALRDLGWIEVDQRVYITELGWRWVAAFGPAIHEMASAPPERQRGLALILGDFWVAAGGASGELGGEFFPQAEQAMINRALWLEAQGARLRDRNALLALASFGRPWAADFVDRILTDTKLDGLTSAALDVLAHWGAQDHEASLVALAQRATGKAPPEPHLRVRAISMVLASYRTEALPESIRALLLEALRPDAWSSEGEAARLHFLLDPSGGFARLARGLHHEVPYARYQSAVALANLGTAEAIEVLHAAGTSEAEQKLASWQDQPPEPASTPGGKTPPDTWSLRTSPPRPLSVFAAEGEREAEAENARFRASPPPLSPPPRPRGWGGGWGERLPTPDGPSR